MSTTASVLGVQEADESRNIVAWTGLRYPWKYCPSFTNEQKKLVETKGIPPGMEGMNMDIFGQLLNVMSAAGDYGYDPENDYRE